MYYPQTKISNQDIFFRALVFELKAHYKDQTPEAICKIAGTPFVSAPTLRNIFGVIESTDFKNFNYENANLIAKHLKYTDFVDFVEKHCIAQNIRYLRDTHSGGLKVYDSPPASAQVPPTLPTQPPEDRVAPRWYKRYAWVLGAGIFCVLALVLWKIRTLPAHTAQKPSYTLSINSTEGDAPQNVTINYDISAIDSDNVWLFCGGKNPSPTYQKKLVQKVGKVSFFHLNPDYRPLFLVVDGVFFPTGKHTHVTAPDWVCTIDRTHKATGQGSSGNPFPKNIFYHKAFLGLDTPLSAADDFDYWQHFRYFNKKLEAFQGNDFTLEAEVSNAEAHGGVSCFDTFFFICAERERVAVNFTQKGCEPYTYMRVGKDTINSRNKPHLAKRLEQDFQDFRKIKIHAKNQQLSVYYEGTLLCEMPYTEKHLGKIKGLIIGFKGAGGRVRNVLLRGGQARLALYEAQS